MFHSCPTLSNRTAPRGRGAGPVTHSLYPAILIAGHAEHRDQMAARRLAPTPIWPDRDDTSPHSHGASESRPGNRQAAWPRRFAAEPVIDTGDGVTARQERKRRHHLLAAGAPPPPWIQTTTGNGTPVLSGTYNPASAICRHPRRIQHHVARLCPVAVAPDLGAGTVPVVARFPAVALTPRPGGDPRICLKICHARSC